MNFEEFHAIQNRRRTRAQQAATSAEKKTDNTATSTQGPDKPEELQAKTKPTLKEAVGLLEQTDFQTIIVLLIFIDIFVRTLSLYIITTDSSGIFGYLSVICHYVSVFSAIIFSVEITFLVAAFRLKVLSHPGYLIDIVSISLGISTFFASHSSVYFLAIVLLSFLRIWRIIRLLLSYLTVEYDKYSELSAKAGRLSDEVSLLEQTRSNLESIIKQQEEYRKEYDKSVLVMKGEVETLTEALRIAAEDVAMVGMDEEEEEEEEEENYTNG